MENLVKIENEQIVTDSRQIAEHFEKQHKDVLEAIRQILTAENSAVKFFKEYSYLNSRGKQYPCYLMNRDGFTLLAMGFTGKKALEWKLKYIAAFNEMEAELKKSKSQVDILVESALALQRQERELMKLKAAQEEQSESIKIINSRVDTLNGVNIEGTPRQKLNAMVRLYANKKGINYAEAWKTFHTAYNTAYHTNIKLAVRKYNERYKDRLKVIDWLDETDRLFDALRVMDKILNNEVEE